MSPNQSKPEPIPLHLSNLTVTLVPHHIDRIGARVFLVLDNSAGGHMVDNLTLDNLRDLEGWLKLAILEAEALERVAHRRRA